MKQEETFVRMIKEKLEGDQPAYDPAYWERAEAQIRQWEAEDEPRKRPLLWWWLGGLLVLLAGSATAYFSYYTPSSNTPSTAQSFAATYADRQQAASGTEGTVADPVAPTPGKLRKEEEGGVSESPTTAVIKPLSKTLNAAFRPATVQAAKDNHTAKSPSEPIIMSIAKRVSQAQSSEGATSLSEIEGNKQHWNLPIDPLGVDRHHQATPQSWRIRLIAGLDVNSPAQSTEAARNTLSRTQGTIGVWVNVPIKAPFLLETGLQYAQYNLSNVQLTAKGTTYNFGATEQELLWMPTQVQEFQVPVRVLVPLIPRHRLVVGGGLHYVWRTNGSAQFQTTNPFGEGESSVESFRGITYGVNRLGASFQLGYEMQLTPSMSLGLQYQKALRDLTDNRLFGDQVDRSQHLRLIVTYQLR